MHVLTVIRTYLGMSQVALSKAVGITQADLSEIETKEPYGKIDKYLRISKYLGVPQRSSLPPASSSNGVNFNVLSFRSNVPGLNK